MIYITRYFIVLLDKETYLNARIIFLVREVSVPKPLFISDLNYEAKLQD